jgi:AcrR family transcriptional regulator
MTAGASNLQFEWIRRPQQVRSQRTLDRTLDAAVEVIAERGLANATVAAIVERAQSSVGSFYTRFRDKEGLLRCLHERFCNEALATAKEALDPARWRGAGIEEILRELIPFLVSIYRTNAGLMRAFLERALAGSEEAQRGAFLQRAVAGRLALLLEDRLDEIRHPNPSLAIVFGLRIVLTTLDHAAAFEELTLAGPSLRDQALVDELLTVFLSYLGVPERDRADRGMDMG